MIWAYCKRPRHLAPDRIVCPLCGKGSYIACIGDVCLAVCCAQVIYFSKDESAKRILNGRAGGV